MSQDFPNRKNIRLKHFNYSQPGAYFITICAQNRECLFGKIQNEKMVWNDAGKMVQKWWIELENKFTGIKTNLFVIMPNHVHGIVCTVGADLCVGPIMEHIGPIMEHIGPIMEHIGPIMEHIGHEMTNNDPSITNGGASDGMNVSGGHTNILGGHMNVSGGHTGPPLPRIIQWFKTMTTNEYLRRVKCDGWQPFNKRLWQRNYYEHVIRDEYDFERICEYITNNPLQWAIDDENPERSPKGD